MQNIINIIVFLLILGSIIIIHELGHFLAAKYFRVYCSQFSIGFGPKIWSKQGKETAINDANKYRNEQIPGAEAESDKILQDAEASKQQRINEANGQVARFNAMYEEYAKYPEVTKKRMFYEAVEDILPEIKVIIQSADGNTSTVLPLDSFVSESNSSINDRLSDEKADGDTEGEEE